MKAAIWVIVALNFIAASVNGGTAIVEFLAGNPQWVMNAGVAVICTFAVHFGIYNISEME